MSKERGIVVKSLDEFHAADELDEEHILARLEGKKHVLEKLFYRIEYKKKDENGNLVPVIVEDLSIKGTQFLVQKMVANGWRFKQKTDPYMEFNKETKSWMAMVTVIGESPKGGQFEYNGVATYKLTADEKRDAFAPQIALNKAERNAYNKMLPRDFVLEMMKKYQQHIQHVKLQVESVKVNPNSNTGDPTCDYCGNLITSKLNLEIVDGVPLHRICKAKMGIS